MAINQMKSIVLAAGQGTRLRPLTYEKPKALVDVGSVSILEHLIQQYDDAGIDEVVVVTGYKAESIRSACEDIEQELNSASIIEVCNEDYDTTDNIYSLYLALKETGTEPFMLSNGDVFCDQEIINLGVNNPEQSIAFYDSTDFQEEELKLELENGEPVGILDKGRQNGAGATIGMFAFNNHSAKLMFEDLKTRAFENGSDNWFEASLDAIFPETKFKPVDVNDYRWIEIDTQEDLKRAYEKFGENPNTVDELFDKPKQQ